jgi:hypothetical protein
MQVGIRKNICKKGIIQFSVIFYFIRLVQNIVLGKFNFSSSLGKRDEHFPIKSSGEILVVYTLMLVLLVCDAYTDSALIGRKNFV